MGILDNPTNIMRGMKPALKNRPDPDLTFPFDKTKPLGPYNFPTYSYAHYRIKGVKKDAAGIRRPIEWTEVLPMGKRVKLNHPKNVEITGCERMISGPRQYWSEQSIISFI